MQTKPTIEPTGSPEPIRLRDDEHMVGAYPPREDR